jgi:hypothetical protein
MVFLRRVNIELNYNNILNLFIIILFITYLKIKSILSSNFGDKYNIFL